MTLRITGRFPRSSTCPARLLPRLALLRDRLKDYRPALPSLRTPLGTGSEYTTLGEPDPPDQLARVRRRSGSLLAPDLARRLGVDRQVYRRPGFGSPDP